LTPDPIRLDAIANSSDAAPVVIFNLNRYREVADEAERPDHGSEI
jgi:hypothetical protein